MIGIMIRTNTTMPINADSVILPMYFDRPTRSDNLSAPSAAKKLVAMRCTMRAMNQPTITISAATIRLGIQPSSLAQQVHDRHDQGGQPKGREDERQEQQPDQPVDHLADRRAPAAIP